MKSVALALILFCSLFIRPQSAFAQNASGPTIFDVRRSLPLEPDEEVTKDFYINAGPESGLKKGVYVSVVRPVPVHDPIKNMQQATLNIPVGKLKVIDVQRGITVARLESELTDDDRPTLEFEGVMVGDRIDLGTITSDAPKKPKAKPKKVAVVHAATETPEDDASAQAMAVRSAAPPVVAPAAPVAAATMAPSAVAAASPKTVELSTTADVKPESSPAPAPSARNNSTATPSQSEEAPKKSSETAPGAKSEPKSAESDRVNLPRPMKKSFAAVATTDSVRFADYSDAGF